MNPLRIYLDTSVIGGCLDPEFAKGSNHLMNAIRSGRCIGVISRLVLEELSKAPPAVQAILEDIPPDHLERYDLEDEARELRDRYIAHGILTPKSLYDASHVALATVHRVDAIVSWNFKHIV